MSKGRNRHWGEWRRLQNEMDKLNKKEEAFWFEKARAKWLKEGDNNSRFLHVLTVQMRHNNAITRLIDDNEQLPGGIRFPAAAVAYRPHWRGVMALGAEDGGGRSSFEGVASRRQRRPDTWSQRRGCGVGSASVASVRALIRWSVAWIPLAMRSAEDMSCSAEE
ncbi:7-dimethyl-8-ribityllumazine synthase [Striga asiatica]|uniref:7-dimethyl-8-ribityllumazine synthase n=1 Tax=Striga asiatica TaxID=4170 RepID=A0A5A7NXW5_STRAF|nr:7-dimethyl-8-ribityllumazine synthase [Striga asiatica]